MSNLFRLRPTALRPHSIKGVALMGLCLSLLSCAGQKATEKADQLVLEPAAFDDLHGWESDSVADTVVALVSSCQSLVKRNSQMTSLCDDARHLTVGDNDGARRFFESRFRPYAATAGGNADGLFTGYYEAELNGSLTREGRFQTPLYARPDDLITVDLGLFKEEWKGKHLIGKVSQHSLQPYDDRAAIASGSLAERGRVLAWVDDPVDAFFLSVQGSGQVHLQDGSILQLGFDGGNGHAYLAIGRPLAEDGSIDRPVTMQKIRLWLASHPDKATDIMNLNGSYAFFRVITGPGPIGAEGVPLTPGRSLAVDPSFIRLGTLIWLETATPDGKPLTKLVIAQDTGGAIKGPLRGDYYWGAGSDAATSAGAMQSPGHFFVLQPK